MHKEIICCPDNVWQDLESYVQNHSAERLSRIEAVGRQLADAHIMPAWIRAQLDGLATRWETLRARARDRAALLEAAARRAARSEVSVDALHQWLADLRPTLAADRPLDASHALVTDSSDVIHQLTASLTDKYNS